MQNKEVTVEKLNKKVAIIGSGPAGISCAGDLQKWVMMLPYSKLHTAGGVLMYGIPEFRL